MYKQLSWKVGGQQGEGIESTGEIFCIALNRLGFYLNGYRHFSSRIKGGHTNNKIRVSITPVRTIVEELHILVAFDQETIDVNHHELVDNAIIIADEKFDPVLPENCSQELFVVPFSETAVKLGNQLMKNMVAIGASAAAMNLDTAVFTDVVNEVFAKKGEAVIQSNIDAIRAGSKMMHYMLEERPAAFEMEKPDGKARLFIIGNDAVGMGLLAGGVRFMGGYPITPATEIMEYLIKHLPEVGGAVIQTEDEIAAVTMAIGASYAGVRAVTSTSGPGLSLMMEAIGLASMTETPLTIVDVQRGGPSTGLATKTEQSDLMAAIYGSHGESPKIILAPSTVEEAFYDAAEALNLAEEYQCPVILIIDMQMGLGKQTAEIPDLNKVEIRRGKLVRERIEIADTLNQFKRYELTEGLISPRVIPGMPGGLHHVTGVEHDEFGRPCEETTNRAQQMNKRLQKVSNVKVKMPVHIAAESAESDILFVGFNSTRGAIEETMEQLTAEGMKVNHAHLRLIHPFPAEIVRPLLASAKKIIVVENNATGQLAKLIQMNLGFSEKINSILKYDGNPLLPSELYQRTKELI